LLEGDAVGGKHLHGGGGDLLRRYRHRGEVVGLDVEEVPRRRLRQHQRMAGRARHNIEESQNLVVVVDLVARQFATQDFRENVLRVVAGHGWSPQSCSCSAKSLRNGASAASSSPAAST